VRDPVRPATGVRQRALVPGQPVGAGRHVQRPGDRRDPLAAGGDQVFHGQLRAAHVVRVHV
jgi:hypothetical protein